MTDNEDDLWYRTGLRFTCSHCGVCCGGAPGYVWVTKGEIAAMAQYLDLSIEDVFSRYVRKVWTRMSLNERPNGDCIMLAGSDCAVYRVRPKQCRTFPFWSDGLRSRSSWEALKKRCTGVGRGKLWSKEDISAVLQGRRDATTTDDD